MKDRKFLALSSFFFLLFFLAIAGVALDRPLSLFLRAKNVTVSPLKSFVIVFPQIGAAGLEGSDKPPTKIKVTVYLRDINGNVVSGHNIKLASSLEGTSIIPADTQPTNELGMVQFFLSSPNPGKSQLAATDLIGNISVMNIPSVEFTQ